MNDSLLSELSRDRLKQIQAYLSALGYYAGSVDGVFGKHTSHAWASWKADNWLNRHTEISDQSFSQLKEQAEREIAVDWSNFNAQVSEYFTVREVTNGDRQRIPTDPTVRASIIQLAKELDWIRESWGSAIAVTSWYRPANINRAVGGASRSQHILGKAADIKPVQGNIATFQNWLDTKWDKALGYGAKKGFVHVDLRPGRIRWNY